jgi:signal transduction histidine kinase
MSDHDANTPAALLRQQESLREVIESISSELELRPLLMRIVQNACALLDAENGTIGLVDFERDVVRTEAAYGMPPDELGTEIPRGVGLYGQIFETQKPLVLNRYGNVPVPTQTDMLHMAVIGVPILWRGQMIGVFGLGSPPPRTFTEQDVDILTLFGKHAAIAIENARLFARTQEMAVLQERQRLARDLHDSVTQLLFSITLIAQSIGPAWKRNPEEGEQRIERLLELSQSALREMRTLLIELRPPASGFSERTIQQGEQPSPIERQGLVELLQQHCSQVMQDGLPVTLESSRYHTQQAEREEALFRITQEALNNVVKHAHATRATIQLSSNKKTIELTVKDDGLGFTPPATMNAQSGLHGGMGLDTMRERAEALGGTFQLQSSPGAGTTVQVTLPAKE